MIPLQLLFLVLAIVCFLLAAIGIPSERVNLQATGLLFLTIYLGFGSLR